MIKVKTDLTQAFISAFLELTLQSAKIEKFMSAGFQKMFRPSFIVSIILECGQTV